MIKRNIMSVLCLACLFIVKWGNNTFLWNSKSTVTHIFSISYMLGGLQKSSNQTL
jgi:hypothetical protein